MRHRSALPPATKGATIDPMSEPTMDIPADWDTSLQTLRGHFLQSHAWAQFQYAQEQDIVSDQQTEWSWMGVVRRGRGVAYLYAPYGPTAITPDAMKQSLTSLTAKARELHLDFVRFEPMGEASESALRSLKAHQTGEVQPQHTWIQDLTQDEADLKTALSSGHRNAINAADRNGLSMTVVDNPDAIEAFLAFMHGTSAHNGFRSHPDSYFKTMLKVLLPLGKANLFYAYASGKPVFGVITYQFNGTWYYAHAAGDQDLSRTLKVPPALVWHIMLTAKAAGAHTFDFWGVNPPDKPNHPWAGLSQFKRSFGGKPMDYAGTWDIPVRPLKYATYHFAKGVLSR